MREEDRCTRDLEQQRPRPWVGRPAWQGSALHENPENVDRLPSTLQGMASMESRWRNRNDSWRLLRGARSRPVGMAGREPKRGRTFQAALEQSEQFLRSAEGAGPETRPLHIFYGLSQAGRAIAAASSRLNDFEYRPVGHGMRTQDTRDQTDLWRVAIEVTKSGTPQVVAKALDSVIWPAKTQLTLAELWPLLPDTAPERGPHELSWFTALRYEHLASGPRASRLDIESAWLSGVPWSIYEKPGSPDTVEQWLTSYPKLAGWLEKPRLVAHGGNVRMLLTWPARVEHAGWREFQRLNPQLEGLPDIRAPWVRRATQYGGEWWALPALRGMSEPVHPLLAWWAILLALSSLARYEPETWAHLIDVDRPASPAVAIEHLMEEALSAIPALTAAALAHVSVFASR
ncbi:YaaC family protein [Streptomyces sioyaensis]|uniref:YaaC family protein n=1 Tax=Streptomyces sioyaensis TaxID=67364 RepID=UPI0036956020